MSVGSLVDLDVGSTAGRRESSVTTGDQRDRKRSGKLQETWQQVKKVSERESSWLCVPLSSVVVKTSCNKTKTNTKTGK